MNMNNKTRIILIILCVLLIVASGCGIAFALMNSSLVSAEYLDLADTNTMINFNQLFNNTTSRGNYNSITFTKNAATYKITGYFTNYSANLGVNETTPTISLISGHTYYLDFKLKIISGPTPNLRLFNSSASSFNNGNETQLITMSSNQTCSIGFYVLPSQNSSSNQYNFEITPMLIDLTQCFGSQNMPTLEQAQEFFTADYYNYTTGTPMPYSKTYLQGYQDAAKDIYSSMNVTYSAYTIGTNSFNYWNNNIQAGTFSFDNVYSAYTFSGVLGINLSSEIQANTTIGLDFELYIPDLQGEDGNAYISYPLYIAYVDENNNLVQFNRIAPALTNEVYTLSYKQDVVLPVNTSVIYIYLNYAATGSNTSPTIALCFKSAMTFTTTDIGLLMNNAYQRGADDTNKLYAYGTERYNDIYNTGYTNALETQNATLGAMGYISAAFTNVGEILQIELLPGIPISIFLLFPLMLGLITLVVKLTKGD